MAKPATVKSIPVIPKKQIQQRKPADADFTPDNPDLVQSGMKVEHNLFGIGKVVHVEGISPTGRPRFFQEIGEEKQLLLKFAKLRIVGNKTVGTREKSSQCCF